MECEKCGAPVGYGENHQIGQDAKYRHSEEAKKLKEIEEKEYVLTEGLEHPVDILKDLMRSCGTEMSVDYEKMLREHCDKE